MVVNICTKVIEILERYQRYRAGTNDGVLMDVRRTDGQSIFWRVQHNTPPLFVKRHKNHGAKL